MTIIAAAFNNANDYAIAGDSESQDDNGNRYQTEKVWRWGSILIGYDGYHTIAQRARRFLEGFATQPTTREAWVDVLLMVHAEMLNHVGPAQPDCPRGIDVRFLTVGPWGIVQMDPVGAVFFPKPYAAIGCGGPVAMGAMRILRGMGHSAISMVEQAVPAAIAHNTGCGGVPVVLTSEPSAHTVVEPNGDYVHVLPDAPKSADVAPDDPASIAAWLCARVVLEQTVVESRWKKAGEPHVSRRIVLGIDRAGADLRLRTCHPDADAILNIGRMEFGSDEGVQLINPDGTVLWEAP